MSNKIVALRLNGALQSWGYNSDFSYRNTGLFPTKSAVLGLCCAAKGLSRGSEEERSFLESVYDCKMMAIALPRIRRSKDKMWPVNVRRIEDFHTVENTKTASGKSSPNTVITYRQYLCDADFIILLKEVPQDIADDLENNLSDPTWGIWLGRKSCIPSAPVFAGVYANMNEVSNELLNGRILNQFTHQQEASSFEKGSDTIMDNPIDYAIDKRKRGQRRVKIFEAEV